MHFVTFEYLIRIKENLVGKYLGYHNKIIMYESFSLNESFGNVIVIYHYNYSILKLVFFYLYVF